MSRPPSHQEWKPSQDGELANLASRRHIVIAKNPVAGKGDSAAKIDQLAVELQKRNFQVEICSDLGVIKSTARTLADQGRLRCLVSAGGDGSIRLMAEELGPELTYAVFPLGTENLLAKFWEIRADPERFSQMIETGKTQRMDAALANGKLFLIMVSCGFDADVVRRLHRQRSGPIWHGSYLWPIFRTIQKYRFPPLSVTLDNEAISDVFRWVFVFNVPRYAMNLPLAPHAQVGDGKLDVCTFRKGSFFNGLFYIFRMLIGRRSTMTDSRDFLGAQITISATDPDVPYQIDGDPGGMLPVQVKVLPRYLSLIVP